METKKRKKPMNSSDEDEEKETNADTTDLEEEVLTKKRRRVKSKKKKSPKLVALEVEEGIGDDGDLREEARDKWPTWKKCLFFSVIVIFLGMVGGFFYFEQYIGENSR